MLDFGEAIRHLKASPGNMARRHGWNGKGMYIFIEQFNSHQPCITMYTAQGELQPGWLASQADMLSEDWEVNAKVDPDRAA